MTGITLDLARCITGSSYEGISPAVRHEAKRSILNWLGCALGGCHDEAVVTAIAALSPFSGPPQATVLGRGMRLDMMHAALVNALSSNILDFDDTHARMVVHPTAPVASAVLALAEHRSVSGPALLHAFILGTEVECRLLDPAVGEYNFAWSPATSVGAFGAAAGAGYLLGLDEQQMASALGIAATQAAGLRATAGTMSKGFNPGHAARCGLTAAILAAKGFTGSHTAIEGVHGFMRAFGTLNNAQAATRGWGETFHISLNTYKPFPCGIVTHPAIDGCLQLRAEHRLEAQDIASVSLSVHPLALRLTGRKAPASGLEAKLSVYYTAACALVYGAVGVREFGPECLNDSRVVALRQRIEAAADDTLGKEEARVNIKLRDGRTYGRHVPHALGSAARPLPDDYMTAKFRALAGPVLPPGAVDQLLEMVWSLESLDDAGAIARCAAAIPGRAGA
jgi:2-methylcitrate dehydratase PrpD